MRPDAVELRILGCLIEKQRTTPDAYPLSLNALRLAANQSTNRDPVVDYDEATIRDALNRLYRRRWTRLASGHGSRAAKFRHLLKEELGLDDAELALLAVLLLRGPQTPGELNQRAARLHTFAGLADIEETLERLIGRGMVERLARRPGQKEERYTQRLGDPGEPDAVAPAPTPPATASVPSRPRDDDRPAVSERRAYAPDYDDRPAVSERRVPAPADDDGRAAPERRVPALADDDRPAAPEWRVTAPADDDRPAAPERRVPAPADDDRLATLEREVAALRAEVGSLRAEMAALRTELGG